MFYFQDVLRLPAGNLEDARCFISQKDVLSFQNILNMFKKFVGCFKFLKYLLDVLKHLSDI
jgi:hypothetical protein